MVKALFALAKYLTSWFIKPLVSRCCVANLTLRLQTSSFNRTHVLVASNSISLSCLEGRIYNTRNKSGNFNTWCLWQPCQSFCMDFILHVVSIFNIFRNVLLTLQLNLISCFERSFRLPIYREASWNCVVCHSPDFAVWLTVNPTSTNWKLHRKSFLSAELNSSQSTVYSV